jgi:hypothetical protein
MRQLALWTAVVTIPFIPSIPVIPVIPVIPSIPVIPFIPFIPFFAAPSLAVLTCVRHVCITALSGAAYSAGAQHRMPP